MTESNQVPPAAIVVRHQVADWSKWKAAFDAHEEERKASGIIGHMLNRDVEDPNMVTAYLAVGDTEAAASMLDSDELKQAMMDAGVQGPPQIMWVKPIHENAVWDRDLPAMMIRHAVEDFDTWYKGYQVHNQVRDQAGIIGEAVNQVGDDPNMVLAYCQAESIEELQAFAGAPGLADAMKAAGVVGKPEFDFVNGGWAKFY